jgi:hypothetical protein
LGEQFARGALPATVFAGEDGREQFVGALPAAVAGALPATVAGKGDQFAGGGFPAAVTGEGQFGGGAFPAAVTGEGDQFGRGAFPAAVTGEGDQAAEGWAAAGTVPA